jgi:hypothetical protein
MHLGQLLFSADNLLFSTDNLLFSADMVDCDEFSSGHFSCLVPFLVAWYRQAAAKQQRPRVQLSSLFYVE